jgi:hypothetical protein
LADRLVDFLNQQRLFKESLIRALLWSALSGNSRALNRLQFDVWVFGIAFLNMALFDMALRQFCLHVLHVEGQQSSGCSLTYLKAFVAYLKAYVFSQYGDCH